MYIQKDQYLCCLVLFKKKRSMKERKYKNTGSLFIAAILKMAAIFKMNKSECLFLCNSK